MFEWKRRVVNGMEQKADFVVCRQQNKEIVGYFTGGVFFLAEGESYVTVTLMEWLLKQYHDPEQYP